MALIDMGLSACSGSTATDWRENLGLIYTEISKQKPLKTVIQDNYMALKSFGLL